MIGKILCFQLLCLALVLASPVPTTPAPVEATQVPVETTQAPVETTQAPVETTQAPVETTQAPVETTQAPVETTRAPVETTRAPVETTQAPVETTQAPVEATSGRSRDIDPIIIMNGDLDESLGSDEGNDEPDVSIFREYYIPSDARSQNVGHRNDATRQIPQGYGTFF